MKTYYICGKVIETVNAEGVFDNLEEAVKFASERNLDILIPRLLDDSAPNPAYVCGNKLYYGSTEGELIWIKYYTTW